MRLRFDIGLNSGWNQGGTVDKAPALAAKHNLVEIAEVCRKESDALIRNIPNNTL